MTYSKSKKMKEMGPMRTAQHCAQCTAHGRISLLKGHKKVCPFKECRCVHCVLVNNKRQIMAKQVKLKRLQEKNHARQRHLEKNKTSLCGPAVATSQEKKRVTSSFETRISMDTPQNKLSLKNKMKENPALKTSGAYLDGATISEMQHYQEEAWRAICAQNSDLELQTFLGQEGSPTSEQWSLAANSVQYSRPGVLQQLHNPPGPIMLQPCYPVTSSTTAINLFTTPIGEPEALPLNHVFTQPVYYHCIQPDCTQNVPETNQLSSISNVEDVSCLQLLEVVPFVGAGNTQIAAAETLLTLNTGEE